MITIHYKYFIKALKRIAFVAILFFFAQDTFATHIVGGDIEYECIGPRTWRVRLTLYRDCTGIPLCGSPACTQSMVARPNTTLNPPSCSASPNQVNFTVNYVKVQDVGLSLLGVCGNLSKNGCTNMNTVAPGPYTPSIEGYTFEGTLSLNLPTLNAPNTCPYWDIFWESCCRNFGINNLANPGGTGFRIGATINIFWESQMPCKNNSPQIRNEPVAIVCSGQEYVFNMGAVDVDQDSLTYEIGQSLNTGGGSVQYQPPFSANYPFPLNSTAPPHINFPQPSGPYMIIDSINGDISFNAVNNTASFIFGNLNVLIKQWNYNAAGQPVLVGITQRDLQIYVVACPANNPPRFATNPSEPNGRPRFNYGVCAGERICFTVTAKDTDAYPNIPRFDTTRLSWNQGIVRPGKLTFGPTYPVGPNIPRPREDQWEFCWQTEESDGRTLPYYFTVTGIDNVCPNPGRITRAFSIRVLPQPKANGVPTDLRCGRYVYTVFKTDPRQTLTSARLEVANEPFDYSFTNGFQLRVAANPNPPGSGTAPRVMIRDTFTFRKGGKYLIRYTASTPGLSAAQSCTRVYFDTITVDTPVQAFIQDTFVCKGSTMTINGRARWGSPPNLYTYTWFRNSTTGLAVQGPSQTGFSFTASDTLTTKYYLRAQDLSGCSHTDSMVLEVKNLPVPLFSPDTARICFGETFTLNAGNNGGNIRTYRWFLGSNIIGDDTTQSVVKRDSGMYVLLMTDTFGCRNRDTFRLFVNQPVLADAGLDTSVCPRDTVRLFAKGGHRYQWDRIQGPVLVPVSAKGYRTTVDVSPTVTTDYVLTSFFSYPDTLNKRVECFNRDTVRVVARPLPNLNPLEPSIFCSSKEEEILPIRTVSPAFQQGGTGVWSYNAAPSALQVNGALTTVIVDNLPNLPRDTFFNGMTNVANINTVSRSYWIRYSYRGPVSAGACLREDSMQIRIYSLPSVDAGPAVQRCINGGVLPLNTIGGHTHTPRDLTGRLGVWTVTQGGGLVVTNPTSTPTTYSFDPAASGVNVLPNSNILQYEYTVNYNLNTVPARQMACVNRDTVRFFVVPTPAIEAGSPITVCKNEPIFSISSRSGATTNSPIPGSTYWYADPSQPINISQAVIGNQQFNAQSSVVPVSGGTWRMIFRDTSSGCVISDTTSLTVAPLPVVDIDYQVAGSNDSVCKTVSSVQLRGTATPTGGVGNFSGTAISSTGLFDVQSSAVIPQNSYVAFYNYTSTNGCTGYDSIITFVQQPPTVNVSSVPPKCDYDTTLFNLSATLSPSFYGLLWSGDGSGTFTTPTALNTGYRFSSADAARQFLNVTATSTNNGVCVPASGSVRLDINPRPTSDFWCDTCEGCVPFTARFAAKGARVGGSIYEWWFDGLRIGGNDSIATALNSSSGKRVVRLRVTTPAGCTSEFVDTVRANAVPNASFFFDPPKTTIARPVFNFYNTTTIGDGSKLNHVWNFGPDPTVGGTNKPDRLVTGESPQNVQFGDSISTCIPVLLTVTSDKGCVDTAIRCLQIDPDITVFIPSAFRPVPGLNTAPCADPMVPGCNDKFIVYAAGFATIEIFVFNRWGQQVFSSNTSDIGWNGTVNNIGDVCPQDVYIYQVNATSFNGKKYTYSGSLTLLR